MAERSKAPDSSQQLANNNWYLEFWSSIEGVGSNPTSDKLLLPELTKTKYYKYIIK